MKEHFYTLCTPLSTQEIRTTNGGSGGEDIDAPITAIIEALKHIRIM